ncbi:MAG: purine-nucleoside phosphorylase [Oscillospiraceae bacterium]|jgi:purine-nucleoside phosphorylase|nr:purine-nucleoside phosphorylase [Oscillospiraceae bacterium]
MTPQNEARKGEFAKTVLMPGDPLRAKFVAENFLTDAKLVNNVRYAQGYTGTYKGTPISVMSSGMGIPSMGIYSYELYNVYDVDHIIRIGTAGGISEKLKLRDVVAAMGASTNSAYAQNQFKLFGQLCATASYRMLETCVAVSRERGSSLVVGNAYCTDNFYDASGAALEWGKLGCLVVEMESYALYTNALQAGKEALALFTVSDHIVTGEEDDPQSRQNSYTEMMEIALETAVRIQGLGVRGR